MRVKLKGSWQVVIIINGCAFRSKNLLKCLDFNLKSFFSLFPINIGGIKGAFLLLQIVFRMDQYVLELDKGLDNLLANISK